MVKQLRLVVGLMFVGVLIYSGLWFTAAFEAEKDVAKMLAHWRDKGNQIQHGTIESGGFPYRITVYVNNLNIATRNKGLVLSAKKILLVSHLWTPAHWIAEAHGVKTSLAGGSTEFSDDFMHASYRQHKNGSATIMISPQSTEDFNLTSLLGQKGSKPDQWLLALLLNGDTSTQESSLYGHRFLNFQLTGEKGTSSFKASGGISGPIIKGWDKQSLATWRDEGGLLELDTIDYAVAGGRTKGSASLTLDENFKLIGSASLVRSGNSHLTDLLNGIGLTPIGTHSDEGTGPTSLMLQLGSLRLNGEPISRLTPLIE